MSIYIYIYIHIASRYIYIYAHDVDHPERGREAHDRPGLREGSEGGDDAQERWLEHPERESDHAVRDEDEPI